MPPDARVMLLLVAGAVVWITLVPFRFVDDASAWLSGVAGAFGHPVDVLSPVHMVPAAVMTFLALRGWPSRSPWILGAIVAIGLLSLEVIQPVVQYRHARVGDVAMQVAGVIVGAMVARRHWDDPCWRPRCIRLIWGAAALAGVVAVLWFGIRAQVGHAIGPLDPSYRLTIGSEVGGERRWHGTVHNAALYAAELGENDAERLATNEVGPGSIVPRREIGSCLVYDFVGSGARVEGIVQVPDLGGAGSTLFARDAVLTPDGLDTVAGSPIASRRSVGAFSESAQQSGAVSVEAMVTPAESPQFGPARIVTISNGVGVRNVTLSQHGDGIELRVRTPRTGLNASRAVARFPGVLSAGERVHLLAVSTGDRATLYVDGRLRGETVLFSGPGAWLGLVPAWGDLPASIALFAPIGIAAAGAVRRRLPGALGAGGVALCAVLTVNAVAFWNHRPSDPWLAVMAVSVAVLAALLASPASDPGTRIRTRRSVPEPAG